MDSITFIGGPLNEHERSVGELAALRACVVVPADHARINLVYDITKNGTAVYVGFGQLETVVFVPEPSPNACLPGADKNEGYFPRGFRD
jgi:hypothetical protein